ncbi:MAG: Ig-like domain-containing protein [Acidobacteriia bacterium]|nr:Ig-like domain-containing protein [Terriglobia bacterium]
MREGRLRFVVAAWTMLAVLVLPSCGFKRQLVSITVIPNTVTLAGPGLDLQFKAVGNYIHPPDSRDITSSVAWQSAATQVVSINATGLATSGAVCGTNITITATAHSDPHDSSSGIVVGTAAVTVTQPPLC